MKVIYRILFVALLLAQLPFLAAQESANPDSRAEELRERRRQKLPESTPPKSPGIVKMLLYMEGGGLYERVNIRYAENQQSATIWDFQARLLIGLRDELRVQTESLPDHWAVFFERMEYARLPETEPDGA